MIINYWNARSIRATGIRFANSRSSHKLALRGPNMKRCSLCSCNLPADSTKRRRLHGTSSSFALQAFVEISSQAYLETVVPRGDKGVDGPFLCLQCHSQLEKISKVKTSLKYLTEDVERKIKQTAAILNITMNPTGKGKSEHCGCKMIDY